MDALILLVQITLKESVPCSHTLATTFTAEPQYSCVQKTCPVTAWPKATITRAHFLKTSYNVNNRNSSSLPCFLRGRGRNKLLQHVTVQSAVSDFHDVYYCILWVHMGPAGLCRPFMNPEDMQECMSNLTQWWYRWMGLRQASCCYGILISLPIFCCVKPQLRWGPLFVASSSTN